MAEKCSAPCSRCGLVNKVGYSPDHAFDLGLWDKDSQPSPFPLFYVLLLSVLKLNSELPSHKTTIPSRNSIAACIENDHLNNSEHGGAIKKR
jgi:hypothetical protein